jgi:hypothetical protein
MAAWLRRPGGGDARQVVQQRQKEWSSRFDRMDGSRAPNRLLARVSTSPDGQFGYGYP